MRGWLGVLGAVVLAGGLTGCPSEKGADTAKTSSPAATSAPPATTTAATAPTASATTTATATASGAGPGAASGGGPAIAPPTGPVMALGGIGLTVPATIKPGEKRPLVVYLHGLGASGKVLVDALKLESLAADKRFVYAAPDGTLDSKKQRFWNAWQGCCDFDKAAPAHVEALRGLLAQGAAHPSVDPKRIYVVGFSNGGFMAHRLACEVEGIAAIASVAGMGPGEGEACKPQAPVAVLQMHGDADDVIAYGGGHALKKANLPRHASAQETVGGWAQRDGCGKAPSGAGTLDLDDKLPEAETRVSRYGGCSKPVELWTVQGGSHFIGTNRRAQEAILGFLERVTR